MNGFDFVVVVVVIVVVVVAFLPVWRPSDKCW